MRYNRDDYKAMQANDTSMLRYIIETDDDIESELFACADEVRRAYYGDEVFLRGLIEFTNYCKNDCYYCGIRCSNSHIDRYRLSIDEIMSACESGYELGYRTFVLQGGEDMHYSDDMLCDIVSSIKERFDECAVTLSIGERSYLSYKSYYDCGADRFLLRHESADKNHYSQLHPQGMSIDNRKRCLYDLKKIGYQVGSGFMVGSPYQTTHCLIEDLGFLSDLEPDMIGIGPFITHKDTPFSQYDNGTLKLTLRLIAILRLLFPYANIPATTALGTISPTGREQGLRAGANVVMPNLTPIKYRGSYELYDDKICTGEEAAECRGCLERRVKLAGYTVVTSRGDVRR